jgi:hypothetical protein
VCVLRQCWCQLRDLGVFSMSYFLGTNVNHTTVCKPSPTNIPHRTCDCGQRLFLRSHEFGRWADLGLIDLDTG